MIGEISTPSVDTTSPAYIQLSQRIQDCQTQFLSSRMREISALQDVDENQRDVLRQQVMDRQIAELTKSIAFTQPQFYQNRLQDISQAIGSQTIGEQDAEQLRQQVRDRQVAHLTLRITQSQPLFLKSRIYEIAEALGNHTIEEENAEHLREQVRKAQFQFLASRINDCLTDFLDLRETEVDEALAEQTISQDHARDLHAQIANRKERILLSTPVDLPKPTIIKEGMAKIFVGPLTQVEASPPPSPVEEVTQSQPENTDPVEKQVDTHETEQQLIKVSENIKAFGVKYEQLSLEELDEQQLRTLYLEAKTLWTQQLKLMESARKLHGHEAFREMYPTWSEDQRILAKAIYTSLDSVPLASLSPEEADDYAEMLSLHSKKYIRKDLDTGRRRKSGYYIYGMSPPVFETPRWTQLRDRVVLNASSTLSSTEEAEVQLAEDDIVKMHIQVSPEEWRAVLKALMAGFRHDFDVVSSIFDDKKARGEVQNATPEEMNARGALLTDVNHWKILPPNVETESMPSMVFYCFGPNKQARIQHLEAMAKEVHAVLSAANITLSSNEVPRYSTPLIKQNGESLPGFYYVLGDGDWKKYLKKQGKLDQVYDPETNYATRLGERITFNLD